MVSATQSKLDTSAIVRRLRLLRGRLTRWIVVDGVAKLLLLALVLTALDLLLDRSFRMDFAQRTIMLTLMATLMLAGLYRWMVVPLEKRTSDDGLLLEVERKVGDCQQNLISGFQLSREADWSRYGFSPDLVAQTIEQGLARAGAVDFTSALNARQLQRSRRMFIAGTLGLALLAVGVLSTQTLNTWFQRNILLGNAQWPQRTYLEIAGVVEGQLKIDRGSNYELKVIVTEESRVKDVGVAVDFDHAGKRTRQNATSTGRLDGREHQLMLHNVNSEYRIRASGGDALTDWVNVVLVEPIDLSELRLQVNLPDYIGGTEDLSGSGPHSILDGSTLSVVAIPNCEVETAHLKWVTQGASATGPAETQVASRLPMQRNGEREFALQLSTIGGTLRSGKYSLELTDHDGRKNLRPIAFEVAVVEDLPPQVAASLTGIGGLVVPRARIPVSFTARDRYGLTATWLAHQWKSSDESAQLHEGTFGEQSLKQGDTTFSSLDREFEYAGRLTFDIEPLQIPPGNILRFVMSATDNQPDRTRASGSSREFLLRVVSEEELRADLLRREIEQRSLFRQNRDNQLQTLTELRALIAAIRDNPNGLMVERERQLLELKNRQKNIGTSLHQIAGRFGDFLAEAINNRLDESEQDLREEIANQQQAYQSLQQRYLQGIMQPLQSLDDVEIFQAAQGLDECRIRLNAGATFFEAANQTADLQEIIVQRMDRILAAMEDSQTYQEIVNQVIALKRLEQNLIESIKSKQRTKPSNGIFDK